MNNREVSRVRRALERAISREAATRAASCVGFTRRLRTIRPFELMVALLAAFGGRTTKTIADVVRVFNLMTGNAVAYKPFHNQLRKAAFPAWAERIALHLLAALTLVLPVPVTIAAAQAPAAPVTVFVVRHAEKGPETPDPSLTAEGRKRAEVLARGLGDARIAAAFASEFKRTQETVAPLAAAGGVTTQVIPAAALDSLVRQIRALPPGSRAVVAKLTRSSSAAAAREVSRVLLIACMPLGTTSVIV